MTTTLSEHNMNNVRTGFRTFTRLFGLDVDPLHAKYSVGESDALEALACIKIMMRGTESMLGKQKHVGQPFDFVGDVKADMAEMMLIGDDAPSTALKRKRNLSLYHLVVDPVVELFRSMEHKDALEQLDAIIDHVAATAFNEDDYGTYDDALVAQAQVRQIVREREEQSKIEAAARKKKNRKEAKRLAVEIETSIDTDSEE